MNNIFYIWAQHASILSFLSAGAAARFKLCYSQTARREGWQNHPALSVQ